MTPPPVHSPAQQTGSPVEHGQPRRTHAHATADLDARAREALKGASTTPFWLDTDERPEPRPALTGTISTDLVVVGGGFTGLWTALLAKERDPGRRVILLEGKRIGWAASGRNGGFCSASLTHGYDNGAHHLPNENDRLFELGLENLDQIEQTVARYGMECEFERTGEIDIATEDYQVADLKESHDPENGSYWLDAEQLAAHIKSPAFKGGLLDTRGNAMVHPAKLCWELLRVITDLGVEVFEDSIVRKIRNEGDRVVLDLDAGQVRAEKVALGTNVFPSLLKRMRLHTVPVYDYAIMTEPLSDAQLAAIGWSGREGLADVANRFHYFRLTADNRILWGGWDAVYHYGKQVSWKYDQRPETFQTLARQFIETFPQLEGVRFTHQWGGAIDTCSRFFQFFTTAYGGKVAYTAGLTGLGVGSSRFGAKVMLDLLSGQRTELTESEMVKKLPVPFPPEPLAWAGVTLTTKAMIKADENQGKRGLLLKTLDLLKMGFDS